MLERFIRHNVRALQACTRLIPICVQAAGLAGKASVAMMGWDVTHGGKKGQMSIAEATE